MPNQPVRLTDGQIQTIVDENARLKMRNEELRFNYSRLATRLEQLYIAVGRGDLNYSIEHGHPRHSPVSFAWGNSGSH